MITEGVLNKAGITEYYCRKVNLGEYMEWGTNQLLNLSSLLIAITSTETSSSFS